jgi:hypothetical protein
MIFAGPCEPELRILFIALARTANVYGVEVVVMRRTVTIIGLILLAAALTTGGAYIYFASHLPRREDFSHIIDPSHHAHAGCDSLACGF